MNYAIRINTLEKFIIVQLCLMHCFEIIYIMTSVKILNLIILVNLFILGNGNLEDAEVIKIRSISYMEFRDAAYDCVYDNECADHEKCMTLHCFDACSIQDCTSRGEHCGAINHIASCYCPNGFVRNVSGLCVLDQSTCFDDDDCGQNAECRQIDDKMKCQCKPDYYLDYLTGTECVERRRCVTKESCGASEICIAGFCMDKCTNHKCLGEHEICLPKKNGHECGCRPGYEYDVNHKCVQMQCRITSDCPDPKFCEYAFGMHLCACPTGYVINYFDNSTSGVDRPCTKSCIDINSCPKNQWCRGNLCVDCDDVMCPRVIY